MKKILLILFLVATGFFSKAQYNTNTATSNASTLLYSLGSYGANIGFVWRSTYADTATANLSFIKNVPGQTIRVGDTVWIRNNAATRWINMMSGSGGGGGLSYYNSNIGAGYRLAIPNTNNIKTMFGRYGVILDSTNNANAISFTFDSTTVFPNILTYISNQTGGLYNFNIGAGYRWVIPNTKNIKTAFGRYGIVIDSTNNANANSFTFDSTKVFPDIRTYINNNNNGPWL